MDKSNNSIDQKKRAFVKKAAYVAPAIVTMAAIPSFASAGSGYSQRPGPQLSSFSSGRHGGRGRPD